MRTVGMTASPDLLSEWRRHSLPWGKWRTRVTVVALGVGSLVAAAVITAGHGKADTYCTPETPYAPYSSVCTGYGTSCGLSPTCTPVPNVPGTMGPNGYTPICGYASCRP